MKLKFVVFLMVVIVSLSAQISNPIEINEEYSDKMSSGQRAYQIIDGEVFITYRYQHGYIYFTRVSATNYQTHTVVDTLSDWNGRFTDPAIQVLENGNIIIVYSEIENSELGYLKIATSTDNGVSFSIETFEITDFGDPHIVKSDDGLDICYSNNLRDKSLAEFQYFTEYEKSENEDGGVAAAMVSFYGLDDLYGPVHSNDDIWIQQYQGWPTFHDMVTTAGRIMDKGTGAPAILSAPMDDIFLGGYEEEIIPYTHNGLSDIRMYGLVLGSPDIDIVYVKLGDGAFESQFGVIEETGVDTFGVYSWFPHNAALANAVINNGGNWYEDADHIWTNHITIYDTTWTTGPAFAVTNHSVWVGDAELWIEGSVYGAQTWGCSDTIFIVGDITYAGTAPGGAPDDPDDLNLTDYFGLASEKKILIRYKHKDPFEDMALREDNCDDIMLYGAYAALGVGDTLVYGNMACHYDGIFTFQYHHPHGSTPDFAALNPYTLQETLYTYVDLHKYIFPPYNVSPPVIAGFELHGGTPVAPNFTCGYPYESNAYIGSYPNNIPNEYVYPYGTDYPWYNPVWPESSDDIVFERGQITMFGSVAQTRRGYIHRSGSDPYNHPGENEWDLDEYHFDGDHPSTGYNKNYNYDSRLTSVQPPHFPRAIQAPEVPININVLHSSNGQNFSESYVEEVGEMLQALWMDSDGESVLIAYQTVSDLYSYHFLISDNDPQEYEHYVVDSEGGKLKNAHILGDEIYVLSKFNYSDIIYRYQIGNPIPELIQIFEQVWHFNDLTVGDSGALAYVHEIYYSYNSMNLDFHYNNEDGTLAGIVNWDHPFNDFSYPDSEISIKLDENNTAYSTILLDQYTNNYSQGQLYLISGELDGIVEIQENEIISPKVSMQIYPNPFNPETTISFSLTTESTEDTEINIYNVKGQKVKQLVSDQLSAGQHKAVWNGKDMNGRSVATGIYLFELRSNGEVQKTKKGLLLK